MRIVVAAVAYFVVVFAVAFALGGVRVLWLAPRLGATAAVALEAPLVLAASWVACAGVARRLRLSRAWPGRLAMGLIAFTVLQGVEITLCVVGFGRSLAEVAAAYAEAPGARGLATQALFALIPVIQGRAGA